MFERTFFAGWGDMDFNSHMRNTALAVRKLAVPPEALLTALRSLPKTDDFQPLASSIK